MKFHTDRLLHGGDYNPDQWLDRPDILEKDIELLKKSGCNVVTLGVFAWSALEPEEGVYQMDWLEERLDRLYENGIRVILATPSGARPKWMADRYREVLRVNERGERMRFGGRHNHCLTSPIYRAKVTGIDRELSRRFGCHPGVILWHLSNELGGECFCPLCEEAFRGWLRKRYGTIEALNRSWVTSFWSHTYRSFEEVEAPSAIGESALHGLNLDWKRFVTDQTADFLRTEREAVREYSNLPVTTNLMYYFQGLNYFRLAREVDLVSWDTYPLWHKEELYKTALDNGMCHDLMRSLKEDGRPFLQMESCPSATNWQGVSKLKKPGVLRAQSLQAVAHGSEGALYFQIRQSRGSSEKFHGAVIDHYGGEDTRVFQEVAGIGADLAALSELQGSCVVSRAAVIYDWESIWAMEDSQGPRNKGLHHHELVLRIYGGLRRGGLNVDLKDETCDLSGYDLVVLPMVYQFRESFEERLKDFVGQGGRLVVSFWTGVADGTDRCFLGGRPHGLMEVLGLRSEEIDGLYDWEENFLAPTPAWPHPEKTYRCQYLCELPRVKDAKPLLTYGTDFYRGLPALTEHVFGKGKAWYVAAFAELDFWVDLIAYIMDRENLSGILPGAVLPKGLEVTERVCKDARYLIYQNFGQEALQIPLPEGEFTVLLGNPDEPVAPLEAVVLKKTLRK